MLQHITVVKKHIHVIKECLKLSTPEQPDTLGRRAALNSYSLFVSDVV